MIFFLRKYYVNIQMQVLVIINILDYDNNDSNS